MRRPIMMSTACAALVVVAGCSSSDVDTATETPQECVPVSSADLATEDGWLGLVEQAPDTVGLIVDDGRGRTVEHRADEEQVLASAVKVVHLAAYGRAVASGELDPNEQIPLLAWEQWYVPGTDGGAHPGALDRLGIENDGVGAFDPNRTVRLDDMVTAMIQESDNAVPDYLRFRLGDQALVDAAAAGGWDGFEAPSMAAASLAVFDPSLGEGDQWATANKWAFDPQFRTDVGAGIQMPTYEDQVTRVEDYFGRGSAAQLSSLYRSVADGSFGDGADVVLRQLEYLSAPDGNQGLGFKGGNLPGVTTIAFELRRDDGTVATAVWLVDALPADRYETATTGVGSLLTLMLDATDSPDTLDRIACVV